MQVGLAQINSTIGDFEGNTRRIIDACQQLERDGADIILTPELALTGYPPQDLLFQSDFVPRSLAALEKIHQTVGHAAWIVGCIQPNPAAGGRPFFNSAAILERDHAARHVHKSLLPTYDVFNETRYFEPAPAQKPVELLGQRVGITIC
jgi:predicted amidohydrolase